MLRSIIGAVIGVVAWFVVVFVVSFLIKMADPALAETLKAHATMATLWERLAISFVGTLVAGAVAARIGRDGMRAPLIAGVLLLLWFVPYHLYGSDPQGPVWTSFPLWYHLTFFVSLLVLSLIGGRLAGSRTA
jgi:hypothetical protein